MLRTSRLRDLVELQSASEAKNSFGETIITWAKVADIYADIQPIRGREYWESFQVQSEVTHKITIRYRAGVVAKNRILFGTRVFVIESVIDVDERHERLELMCEEGAKND